ncbi:MAG: FeoB small GTPase domain-containing protein, partial [Candidatus Eremiobacterota bacterium]
MSKTPCASCACGPNASHLRRLNVDPSQADYVVALAGNPNVGKSTVFNRLTGLRQHTGNWPGKTVSRAEGAYEFQGKTFKLVDLPGTYSLLSTSTDEEIARDFLLFGRPDVTVIVVDATRLERNLNLVLQILQITDRAVLCLNLVDEAKRHGITLDTRTLSRELGIPVVATSARFNRGMDELMETVRGVAAGELACQPRVLKLRAESGSLQEAVARVSRSLLELVPGLPNPGWVSLRLLAADARIVEALSGGEL